MIPLSITAAISVFFRKLPIAKNRITISCTTLEYLLVFRHGAFWFRKLLLPRVFMATGYCKTEGSVKTILDSHAFWLSDSLVVYIDDQERLMEAYLPFLEHPESPDGSSTFCYFGINYYNKERTLQMLEQIKTARPEDCGVLIPWLEKAANQYNGFYFLGI